MTRVIAAIDNSAAASPVLEAACAIADLFDWELEAVHVREGAFPMASAAAVAAGVPLNASVGATTDVLREAMLPPDVAALVIGARRTPAGRRPVGSTAIELITSVPKRVVVVPPDTRLPATIDSILVPLDASPATAAALAETIELARVADVAVIVLHVREEATLHPFSDQLHHETAAWAEEFVARYCPCPLEEVDLHLRVGVPREEVARVVDETGADLIVLGWSQQLEPGRAEVVRETLTRAQVPVMLLPVALTGESAGRRGRATGAYPPPPPRCRRPARSLAAAGETTERPQGWHPMYGGGCLVWLL
jgi:nucleotide-binding universal stress UspA family protein